MVSILRHSCSYLTARDGGAADSSQSETQCVDHDQSEVNITPLSPPPTAYGASPCGLTVPPTAYGRPYAY